MIMKRYFVILIAVLVLLGVANTVLAGAGISEKFNSSLMDTAIQTGHVPTDYNSIEDVIAIAIKTFLGLLGIIFLVLTIYAGYNYMMARGNEQEVEKAKGTLQHVIIGLIIVLSAYAITIFITSNTDSWLVDQAEYDDYFE